MHYYQHNIGDYRRDTIHLTLLEHGAYRQLLDCYYLSESPIPPEPEAIFRKLLARTEEEREAVRNVLNEFFRLTPEGWIHTRCNKEIGSYRAKANKARENGKRGGRPQAGKKMEPKEETPPAAEKTNPVNFRFPEKTDPVISGFRKITDPVFLGFLKKTNPVISGFSEKTNPVISGFPKKTQTKANALTQERNNALTQERNNAAGASETLAQGCRLPEDWTLPEEWRQWAADPPRSLSMEKINDEEQWFKSYWLKCEGPRAYKRDWRATWRHWIEKNLPRKGREKFDPLAYMNGHQPDEGENVIEHS